MARRRRNASWPQTVGPKDSRYTQEDSLYHEHGAMVYVGNDSSVYIYPEFSGYGEDQAGNHYRAAFTYTAAYTRPIEEYTGTQQEMLDLMTARSRVRKMTAKELARIGASKKAQKGVQWKQALVELNRRGKGPDGKRKGKARESGAPLWNPRRKNRK
jgi:hypothetical protein